MEKQFAAQLKAMQDQHLKLLQDKETAFSTKLQDLNKHLQDECQRLNDAHAKLTAELE